MVKYKSRATKAQMTSVEAEEALRQAAEEEKRLEAERLEAERKKDAKAQQKWDARPGPVPIGWDSAVDPASSLEFYWRENDPENTTTWEAPAVSGEHFERVELDDVMEELRQKSRPPRGGEWQFCLQNLWAREEVDNVCNHQRPGSKDDDELLTALTLLRRFLTGPNRELQDLVAASRLKPHEKMPAHHHHASALTRLVDLLRHDSPEITQAAAKAIAAACHSGHRPCQDEIAMAGNAMTLLANMLYEEPTITAACLAIGRACQRNHRGNQDQLAMVPQAAERLLELLEEEDQNETRAVHFAIFWASSNASKPTRTLWERSRGFCMSLAAPKPPVHEWQQAMCHRSSVTDLQTKNQLSNHQLDKEARAAANIAARRTGFMTMGERVLAMMDSGPEAPDIVLPHLFDSGARSKLATQSKQVHIPVAENQDPSHVVMHLATKRATQRQRDHEQHHHERHEAEIKSKKDIKALADVRGSAGPKAIADAGQNEEPLVAHHCAGTLATIDSARSWDSELARELEEHDLHHLDPGLDDRGLCRIGGAVRHCTPTGFLKPLNVNNRYGIRT